MYDIVGKRKLWFAISAVLTIPGLIFIILGGLKPSIDFTGGTEWEARYAEEPSAVEMTAALAELGHPDALVVALDDGFLRIRTEPIDLVPPPTPTPTPTTSPTPTASPTPAATATPAATTDPSASPAPSQAATPTATPTATASATPTATPTPSATPTASPTPAASPTPVPIAEETEFGQLHAALEERFGEADTRSARTVGPIIGADLVRSSVILIIVGELFILGYLWMRFGFRFGTAAMIALLHDVILVVGRLRDPRLLLQLRVRRAVRDRAADDHRLQRPRHDRRLRSDPREPRPPCRASRSVRSSTTRSCRRPADRSSRRSR